MPPNSDFPSSLDIAQREITRGISPIFGAANYRVNRLGVINISSYWRTSIASGLTGWCTVQQGVNFIGAVPPYASVNRTRKAKSEGVMPTAPVPHQTKKPVPISSADNIPEVLRLSAAYGARRCWLAHPTVARTVLGTSASSALSAFSRYPGSRAGHGRHM